MYGGPRVPQEGNSGGKNADAEYSSAWEKSESKCKKKSRKFPRGNCEDVRTRFSRGLREVSIDK